MKTNVLIACASLIAGAFAAPLERRDGACSKYTIIETRDSWEFYGPSSGFITMNEKIMTERAGGETYRTSYDASKFEGMYDEGVSDIVNRIQTTLESDPNHCFALEGYGEGAVMTVMALPKLTGASFDAVKAVFLISNPTHKPGLACNVDSLAGRLTVDAEGEQIEKGTIPDEWVSKSMDVCSDVDGRCGGGYSVPGPLEYSANPIVQNMGAWFVFNKLKGTS